MTKIRDRHSLSQQEKYFHFKNAFETYKTYFQRGDLLSAYVVAFSIFEDRLTACLMCAKDLHGHSRPKPEKHLRHYEKITFLEKHGHLEDGVADAWKKAGDTRNSRLHAAMWNLSAVREQDCQEIIKHARTADRLARHLTKLARTVSNK